MGFRRVGAHDEVVRFAVDIGASGTLVDVRELPTGAAGTGGAGTVHHVAFRAHDDTTEFGLRTQNAASGLPITEQIDRTYFRSMYFREPGQVLFELATDAPGFAVDEPADRLGETLQLPAQHAHLRSVLESRLPTVQIPVSGGL